MSQCAAILDVLTDGQWHTVADIHRRAGYSRLNSRVSELRERGHRIECDVVDAERAVDRYRYRLVRALDEAHDGQARGDCGPIPSGDSVRLVERASSLPDVAPSTRGALPPDSQLSLLEVA